MLTTGTSFSNEDQFSSTPYKNRDIILLLWWSTFYREITEDPRMTSQTALEVAWCSIQASGFTFWIIYLDSMG